VKLDTAKTDRDTNKIIILENTRKILLLVTGYVQAVHFYLLTAKKFKVLVRVLQAKPKVTPQYRIL